MNIIYNTKTSISYIIGLNCVAMLNFILRSVLASMKVRSFEADC